ncbi:MAG: response regulator transcription factor [Leptolyngbyaceae cyanobacterium SM1_3_5]|nr:response regulator transcription factor [Leptolyngbyaceae cyanobacterium SM1_3_5]
MPRSTVLLIDEDTVFCQALKIRLEAIAEVVQATAEMALTRLATSAIDLVLVDLRQGLPLIEQIRAQYPNLPILVLSDRYEPILLAAARQVGATGYCTKDQDADLLLSAIRTVAAGQPFWQRSIPAQAPFARLRRDWRQLGLRRINAALAEINAQLQQNLSPLDRAILEGRARELRTARWLVDRVSAHPTSDRTCECRDRSSLSARLADCAR